MHMHIHIHTHPIPFFPILVSEVVTYCSTSLSFSVIAHQLTSQSENLNLYALWHFCPQITHLMHVIILRRDKQKLFILHDF